MLCPSVLIAMMAKYSTLVYITMNFFAVKHTFFIALAIHFFWLNNTAEDIEHHLLKLQLLHNMLVSLCSRAGPVLPKTEKPTVLKQILENRNRYRTEN